MRAAYINQIGDVDEIKIGNIAKPEILDDDVLVKVSAVSVNFVDTFVRSGSFKTELEFPFVIGRDAVGIVSSMGKNVKDFQIGDLVWTNSMGYDGRSGVTSEFASIPKDRLFVLPKDVDPIKAVAAVHSSATAAILLRDILKVQKGYKILVEGAAGHVGRKLISLAKSMGLKVSTTSNSKDFTELQRLGIENLYDYCKPITSIPDKFDYIIDTSGKVHLQDNLNNLNLGGQIGLITSPKNGRFSFNVRKMYMQDQSIKGFVISHATIKQLRNAAELLNRNFAMGKLLDDEIKSMPMEQAAQAHKILVDGQSGNKKIVLMMDR